MKQSMTNIGYLLKSSRTWASSTTHHRATTTTARTITFPDGGTTPFKGGKLSTWEGGMRAPALIRWPGVIDQDVENKHVRGARLAANVARHSGRAKENALKRRIEAGRDIPAS